MLTNLSRHIVALVSLLIFLLTGQTGVQGYVWCVEEGGKAVLERAENNTCSTDNLLVEEDCHSDEGLLNNLDQDDHCGPCLDIPAVLEVTNSHNQKQKDVVAPAGSLQQQPVLPAPVLVKVLTSDLLSQPPPWLSQTLLAHRTIVLLN